MYVPTLKTTTLSDILGYFLRGQIDLDILKMILKAYSTICLICRFGNKLIRQLMFLPIIIISPIIGSARVHTRIVVAVSTAAVIKAASASSTIHRVRNRTWGLLLRMSRTYNVPLDYLSPDKPPRYCSPGNHGTYGSSNCDQHGPPAPASLHRRGARKKLVSRVPITTEHKIS